MKPEPTQEPLEKPHPTEQELEQGSRPEPEGMFNPPIPGHHPLLGMLKEPIWYAPDFDEPIDLDALSDDDWKLNAEQ